MPGYARSYPGYTSGHGSVTHPPRTVSMRYDSQHCRSPRRLPLRRALAATVALGLAGAGGATYVQTREAQAAAEMAETHALLLARAESARITTSRTATRARLTRPLASRSSHRRIDPNHPPVVPAALLRPTAGDSPATTQARARLVTAVTAMGATQRAYAAAREVAEQASAAMTTTQSELATRLPGRASATAATPGADRKSVV